MDYHIFTEASTHSVDKLKITKKYVIPSNFWDYRNFFFLWNKVIKCVFWTSCLDNPNPFQLSGRWQKHEHCPGGASTIRVWLLMLLTTEGAVVFVRSHFLQTSPSRQRLDKDGFRMDSGCRLELRCCLVTLERTVNIIFSSAQSKKNIHIHSANMTFSR